MKSSIFARTALALVLGAASTCKGEERDKVAAKPAPGPATHVATSTHAGGPAPADVDLTERARELAHELIIVDGHIDVPYRLESGRNEAGELTEDIRGLTEHGDFDYVRARKGGLDAPFVAVFVPPRAEERGDAKAVADGLIDTMEGIIESTPSKFARALSPADVRENFAAGKMSLLLGMENGAPLEGKLENIAHFHDRGIRYITLAHSRSNHISDSSYDEDRRWRGLSPFGKDVVREMNRVGVMVDVSHITDKAFDQVLEISEAPVIASHSSARHFTPGYERNMSDDMIRRMAEKGGMIMIAFGSGFVSEEVRKRRQARRQVIRKWADERKLDWGDPKLEEYRRQYDHEHKTLRATVEDVADHIEHVIELVGPDHVGLGSDFDGIGDSAPRGLEDVSRYPNLIETLLRRGHSEDTIAKLCSGNVLRVFQSVQDHAAARPAQPAARLGADEPAGRDD
jgi:membrane dipeptidase